MLDVFWHSRATVHGWSREVFCFFGIPARLQVHKLEVFFFFWPSRATVHGDQRGRGAQPGSVLRFFLHCRATVHRDQRGPGAQPDVFLAFLTVHGDQRG